MSIALNVRRASRTMMHPIVAYGRGIAWLCGRALKGLERYFAPVSPEVASDGAYCFRPKLYKMELKVNDSMTSLRELHQIVAGWQAKVEYLDQEIARLEEICHKLGLNEQNAELLIGLHEADREVWKSVIRDVQPLLTRRQPAA